MKGYWLGWAGGFALALAISIMVPSLGFIGGVLVGFGLSQLGGLLGLAAFR
jgi:hypothetical protein